MVLWALPVGKTTALNLILGLLHPTDGVLKIDGEVISEKKLSGWRRSVGFVPQDIFLMDASIAQNIAFGVDENKIDYGDLVSASRSACIHDFITQCLPESYETKVGQGAQGYLVGSGKELLRGRCIMPSYLCLMKQRALLTQSQKKRL